MKTSIKYDLNVLWEFTFIIILCLIVVALPDLAFASSSGSPGGTDGPGPAGVDTRMGTVLCTAVRWFTGNTGKGLATIAVTIIGIGALMGKVSWGMAIIVGIGVAIVFGAAAIVGAMGAGASGCP